MYKYVVTGNKVIAISTYAGKTVRGIAKCDPRDKFDVEVGKKLAKARCDEKVAKKRAERAESKLNEADKMLKKATEYYDRMYDYMEDAYEAYDNAILAVDNIENDFM